MNQIFSPARFVRMHRWLWATKSRTYLYAAGALTLLMGLFLARIFASNGQYIGDVQGTNAAVFFLLLTLMLMALTSDVFNALYRQASAITYLMIPASRAEKFWLGIVYCVVAALLLTLTFVGLEALVFSMANAQLSPTETFRYTSDITPVFIPSKERNSDLSVVGSLLLLPLVALLSSFYFRRGVLIRSIGLSLLVGIGFFFLYKWIIDLQFPTAERTWALLPFSSAHVYSPDGNLNAGVTLSLPRWVPVLAYCGTVLWLWVTARVRFNEIER